MKTTNQTTPAQLLYIWMGHERRVALVGPIKRTKAPAVMLEPSRGVVLHHLTRDELKDAKPVHELTTRPALSRYLRALRKRGGTKGARAFLNELRDDLRASQEVSP